MAFKIVLASDFGGTELEWKEAMKQKGDESGVVTFLWFWYQQGFILPGRYVSSTGLVFIQKDKKKEGLVWVAKPTLVVWTWETA